MPNGISLVRNIGCCFLLLATGHVCSNIGKLPIVTYTYESTLHSIYKGYYLRPYPKISTSVRVYGGSLFVVHSIRVNSDFINTDSEIAYYTQYSITGGLTVGSENVPEDSFHIVIGCSKNGESLLDHGDYDPNKAIPLGLHNECYVYTKTNGNDNIEIKYIVKGMPNDVLFQLERDGSVIGLEVSIDMKLLHMGQFVTENFTGIERNINSPFTVKPQIRGMSNEILQQAKIVVLEISRQEGKQVPPYLSIEVQYEERVFLTSTVKCVLRDDHAVSETDWVYLFSLRTELDCYVVSQISDDITDLVANFFISSVSGAETRCRAIGFMFRPAENLGILAADIEICIWELHYSAELGRLSVTEEPLVQFSLSDESTTDNIITKSFDGPLISLPYSTPNFQLSAQIAGSTKDVLDRVVIQYEEPWMDIRYRKIVKLMLSVLDPGSSIQDPEELREYEDRIELMIECGGPISDLVYGMPFGKYCIAVIGDDTYKTKLKLVDSGKRTDDDIDGPMLELIIANRGNDQELFRWIIHNTESGILKVDNKSVGDGEESDDKEDDDGGVTDEDHSGSENESGDNESGKDSSLSDSKNKSDTDREEENLSTLPSPIAEVLNENLNKPVTTQTLKKNEQREEQEPVQQKEKTKSEQSQQQAQQSQEPELLQSKNPQPPQLELHAQTQEQSRSKKSKKTTVEKTISDKPVTNNIQPVPPLANEESTKKTSVTDSKVNAPNTVTTVETNNATAKSSKAVLSWSFLLIVSITLVMGV